MQQRLLCPMIHRVGRFMEERASSQEFVKRTKTLVCAQPPHGVAEGPDKGCGAGTLLPGVDVRAGL